MGGSEKPEDEAPGTASPSSSDQHLATVWKTFRAGGVAVCRRDGGPMALSVDGTAAAYRFVCVACGFASPWFSSGPNGMKVHGIGAAIETLGAAGDE
jgi:hypothetical protein